jgi:hypothetical protein
MMFPPANAAFIARLAVMTALMFVVFPARSLTIGCMNRQWHGERQNHPDLSASIDNSHQQGVAMKDLGHCDVIGRMALPWHAGRLAGSGLGFFRRHIGIAGTMVTRHEHRKIEECVCRCGP